MSPGSVSRFLYLAGLDDAIAALAGGLGIRAERCLRWGEPQGDWGWLADEESYLLFSPVGGDFRFAVDVHLCDLDGPELETKLTELSTQGLLLAVPEEASAGPFEFVLYENGEKSRIVVMDEADGSNDVRIVASPDSS